MTKCDKCQYHEVRYNGCITGVCTYTGNDVKLFGLKACPMDMKSTTTTKLVVSEYGYDISSDAHTRRRSLELIVKAGHKQNMINYCKNNARKCSIPDKFARAYGVRRPTDENEGKVKRYLNDVKYIESL